MRNGQHAIEKSRCFKCRATSDCAECALPCHPKLRRAQKILVKDWESCVDAACWKTASLAFLETAPCFPKYSTAQSASCRAQKHCAEREINVIDRESSIDAACLGASPPTTRQAVDSDRAPPRRARVAEQPKRRRNLREDFAENQKLRRARLPSDVGFGSMVAMENLRRARRLT